MSEKAVIPGVFADIKTVKTRSVVQLIIEIPIEQGETAVRTLGFPQPGSEAPVAIARLEQAPKARPTQVPAEQRHARTPFRSMPVPQQAAMRCGDAVFCAYLREVHGATDVRDADQAAEWLRMHFGVDSRKDIDPEAWETFDGRYLGWKAADQAA